MVEDQIVWLAVATFLPFAAIAVAIVYAGYVAYRARLARERRAAVPATPAGPDPVLELARLNEAMRRELAESAASLERARETVRKGLRG